MNSAVKLALAGAMSIASVSGAMAQTADPMVDTSTKTASTAMNENVTVVLMTTPQQRQHPREIHQAGAAVEVGDRDG